MERGNCVDENRSNWGQTSIFAENIAQNRSNPVACAATIQAGGSRDRVALASKGGKMTTGTGPQALTPDCLTRANPSLANDAQPRMCAVRLHSGSRVPALDGLRGAAVLMVLLLHCAHGTGQSFAGRLFFSVINAGWIGVDLFFVLSGFLITGILIDSKASTHYFRNFYVRRTLRIFPLYYAVLICVLVLTPLLRALLGRAPGTTTANQWWFWVYATNFFPLFNPTDFFAGNWNLKLGHFWSLAVEEHFYLVWPAVVLVLSRTRLIRLCLILFASALAVRLAINLTGAQPPIVSYWLTFCRVDSLAMGALLAAAGRGDLGIAPLLQTAHIAAISSTTAVIAFLIFRGGELSPIDPVIRTLGYSVLAVLFAAVLLLAIAPPAGDKAGLLPRICTQPFLIFFGKYSYGLYIFHFLIMERVERLGNALAGGSFALSIALRIVIGVSLSLGVAMLSWHLMEKQLLKLKVRFSD
jgi:peptidoglycan/LPS O-acetylase OafA/YrhL